MPQGTPEAISLYDTSPLRATLLELVDFDLLNSGAVRVSVGAVQVKTGNMKYFDTARGQTIGPEHIMASGALPPGFPPIEIDGQPYWDGGLVSNTPLQFVLEKSGPREDMVISRSICSAPRARAANLFEIAQREKEIRYSSRTRLNTDIFCELQAIRRAIRPLRPTLPEELAGNTDWQLLDRLSCDAAITIVQLIHRRAAYWTQSNDYEFRATPWTSIGRRGGPMSSARLTIPRGETERPEEGVKVLDLTRDLDMQAQGRAS